MGCKCNSKACLWIHGIISQVAFFAFLFYLQYVLKVEGCLWLSTLILWVLLNISMMLCPFKHMHHGKDVCDKDKKKK